MRDHSSVIMAARGSCRHPINAYDPSGACGPTRPTALKIRTPPRNLLNLAPVRTANGKSLPNTTGSNTIPFHASGSKAPIETLSNVSPESLSFGNADTGITQKKTITKAISKTRLNEFTLYRGRDSSFNSPLPPDQTAAERTAPQSSAP